MTVEILLCLAAATVWLQHITRLGRAALTSDAAVPTPSSSVGGQSTTTAVPGGLYAIRSANPSTPVEVPGRRHLPSGLGLTDER